MNIIQVAYVGIEMLYFNVNWDNWLNQMLKTAGGASVKTEKLFLEIVEGGYQTPDFAFFRNQAYDGDITNNTVV